jgi:hypothetical protein
MEPDDVANVYLKQARLMFEFLNKLKEKEYEKEDLKIMLISICERYYELLMNLAAFTPLLKNYNVKLYKLDSKESKMDLNKPPFEEDFFNNHKL